MLTLEMENHSEEEFIELCNAIVGLYNQIGAYQKAEDLALKAMSGLSAKIDTTIQSYTLYNLGRSLKNQMKIEESAKPFEKAFALVKNDSDILSANIFALLDQKRFSEANQACSLSNCGDFTNIMQIYIGFMGANLNSEEALEAIEKIPLHKDFEELVYDFKIQCYIDLKNYPQALQFSTKRFDCTMNKVSNPLNDFHYSIYKYLQVYIECEQNSEGLIRLNEFMKKFPLIFQRNQFLIVQAIIIYLANKLCEEAEALLQLLEKINPQSSKLSNLYVQLGIERIDNLESAAHCFDQALQRKPNNLQASLFKGLVSCLMQKVKQAEKIPEALVDLVSDFELESDEDADTVLETEIIHYDQHKIHAYFQEQKQQLRLDLSRNLLGGYIEPHIKWNIKGLNYKEDDINLVALNSNFYSGYYAVIAPDLKLDEKMLSQFQIALQKGFCKNKMGKNGIKIIKNSIVELKIDEDSRLYTTQIYKNSAGKSLILFDKIGNHEEIKRLVREKKPLEIIELSERKNKTVNPGNFNGSLFATNAPSGVANNATKTDSNYKIHGI